MPIFGVPVTGSIFVEAESPQMAFEAVKNWSEEALYASITQASLPLSDGINLLLIKAQEENIRDATEEIRKLEAEAQKTGA